MGKGGEGPVVIRDRYLRKNWFPGDRGLTFSNARSSVPRAGGLRRCAHRPANSGCRDAGRVHPLRPDGHQGSGFLTRIGEFLDIPVSPRLLVAERKGPLLSEFRHLAGDGEVAVGIIGIDDCQSHSRVPRQVRVLLCVLTRHEL